MLKRVLWCVIWLLTADCSAQGIESQFFAEGFQSRTERLERYPLDQQYKIFLYGNQIVHPPLTDLAIPIAKRGQTALDYILKELDHSQNDLDYRDSMVVFQTMQWGGYYNICRNSVAINRIKGNENRIRNVEWRNIYSQMLEGLCR